MKAWEAFALPLGHTRDVDELYASRTNISRQRALFGKTDQDVVDNILTIDGSQIPSLFHDGNFLDLPFGQ